MFKVILFIIAGFLIYRLKNVLGKRQGFDGSAPQKKEKEENKSNLESSIPDLKENELELSKVYEVFPDFDHKNFLEGAKFAFEAIINSYNKGDKKGIKPLLTKEVFSSFEKSIDDGNNDPSFQFYSLTINGVESVSLNKDLINITIKFTSEQFKDGDESTVVKKQDLWTFQKDKNNKSTIWLLSST